MMTKRAWLVATLVGLAIPASSLHAQRSFLSLRLGTSVTDMRGEDAPEDRRRIGYAAGGGFVIGFNDYFGFQSEILYAEKGADPIGDAGASLRLHYAEFPVLLRLAPLGATSIQPSVFAGPSLSLRAGCQVVHERSGVPISDPCTKARWWGTQDIDASMVVGGGLKFATSGGAIVVDGRLSLGMRSIDPTADLRTRAYAITAGFAFPLGARMTSPEMSEAR